MATVFYRGFYHLWRAIIRDFPLGTILLTPEYYSPLQAANGGYYFDNDRFFLSFFFSNRKAYSAFRQKFPKLWTSVAHSFLQQIAQNKNWAHPKATTLPRICKVEMQQASLLYCSAKPQSGGILGCALVCPTSLYVRTFRFPTFCRSLPSVGAYSQYPAWSSCRRCADVPRADHDRVGSSPWQGGFKERVYCACLRSICLIFLTCKYAATAFNFKHKKTINVTDLSWPKTFRYRF